MELNLKLPDSIDASPDPTIVEFARKTFPGIADKVIDLNHGSLCLLKQQVDNCKMCVSLDMCAELNKTGGCKLILETESTGFMKWVWTPCSMSKSKSVREAG